MAFIGILFLMLLPFLTLNHFFHFSSTFQAWACILFIIADAVIMIIYTKRQQKRYPPVKIENRQVEVIHVKTRRAVKREDPEDFGAAFYLDVYDQGKQKTLFLWGQYLDELGEGDEQEAAFPNTEFELTRDKNTKNLMDIRLLGTYFPPERTLPSFSREVLKAGTYPLDGELIEGSIDEIT